MSVELRMEGLIKMIDRFLKQADTMLETGVISQSYYDSITQKKKDFLNKHNPKIIPFPNTKE